MTTFRRMAADAVDRAAEELGVQTKSRTRWIRLGSSDVGALRAAVERRTRRLGVSDDTAASLVRCYGDRALGVLDVAEETGITDEMSAGHLPLAAEAVYCARAEMALALNDLLARRTRLALTDRAAGLGPDSQAAAVMGAELGWDAAEEARQVYAHRAAVEDERGAPVSAALPVPTPAPRRAGTG